MKVLLDSGPYQLWRYLSLLLVLAALAVVPACSLYYMLATGDYSACPLMVPFLIVFGGLTAFSGVFGTPVRICDEGILMQPYFNNAPSLVPYGDIREIRFFTAIVSLSGSMSGCAVTYASGMPLTSPEMFSSLESFARAAEPILLEKGFVIRPPEKSRGRREFTFEKR